MRYLKTQLGTDVRESQTLSRQLISSFDSANPSYRDKFHLVRTWLIEFDEEDMPWREIGLDESDSVLLAGPSANDYGFWLDTNLCFSDFSGEPVTFEYFEKAWAASGVVAP